MNEQNLQLSGNGNPTSPELKEPIPESVKNIREMVRYIVMLGNNSLPTIAEVAIEQPLGRYVEDRGFADRVSKNEVNMGQILNLPESWRSSGGIPEQWMETFGKGAEVMNYLIPRNYLELLNLQPSQLANLFRLQKEETERLHEEENVSELLVNYYKNLRRLQIPERAPNYDLEWGVLKGIYLIDGSKIKIDNSDAFLLPYPRIKDNKEVYFGLSIATSIPYVFYQATYIGTKDSRQVKFDQKLIVTGSNTIVEGWDEWFTKVKGSI